MIDTGVGMTPEQITKIFQPFQQVGDIKKRAEGTGLGLTITKQLVELMGSALQVESIQAQGSRFGFEVPFPVVLVSNEIQERMTRKVIGYQGEKRTILLVDDRKENRLVLQNMLEPLGFEIVVGEEGQQEVELARNIKPDLILTDLLMPNKSGFEAVQEIRQISDLNQIPIIVVSANLIDTVQKQSLDSGCNDFLSKPIDEEQLLKLLEKYLQLEWIYEELDSSGLDSLNLIDASLSEEGKMLEIPPSEEMAILHQLAISGNMGKIKQRAVYLKELDQKYIPFALRLTSLAEEFEDEKIIKLVERHSNFK